MPLAGVSRTCALDCASTDMHAGLPVLRFAAKARQLAAALTKAGFKPKDKMGVYSGGHALHYIA